MCLFKNRVSYSQHRNTGDVKGNWERIFISKRGIYYHGMFTCAQIQLNEIASHIINATGSVFGPETPCRALYRLGITRKKIQFNPNDIITEYRTLEII